MKKVVVIGSVLALMVAVAMTASAQGWGNGSGYGMMGRGYGMMGPGYGMMGPGSGMGYGPVSPEAQEAYAKFMQDTLALRQQIAAKNMELRTLWVQPNADKAKLDALRDEIAGLRKQLSDQAEEAGLDEYTATRGYGQGYGRGESYCPGYGAGNGNGYGPRGGGYGGGPYCW